MGNVLQRNSFQEHQENSEVVIEENLDLSPGPDHNPKNLKEFPKVFPSFFHSSSKKTRPPEIQLSKTEPQRIWSQSKE